jgi:bifunctional non-homologous end joining protein LigD
VKWDGYRALAYIRNGTITLRSRNLKDFTAAYPEVVKTLQTITAGAAILDGEIVALDEDGRPSFQALQHRTVAPHAVAYYVFDILHINGRDVLRESLEMRRDVLTSTVKGSRVLLSTELPGSPAEIVAAVKRLGLGGRGKASEVHLRARRRSHAWIKCFSFGRSLSSADTCRMEKPSIQFWSGTTTRRAVSCARGKCGRGSRQPFGGLFP